MTKHSMYGLIDLAVLDMEWGVRYRANLRKWPVSMVISYLS